MRSWVSLAALAAAVVALSVWVYLRPDPQQSETVALSGLKAGEVKRIRLERAAEPPVPPVEIERQGEEWRITAPFSARAEKLQVERLLAVLDARSVGRFPATDLDRYDLGDPQVKVTIDGQTFAFGAVNTATREQYVLTGNAVYAIPLAQRTAVPRDPDALISHALFAPGEAPVRLELPELSAALEDGAWKITPAREDLGPDERNAWAERWSNALAVRAARHDGRSAEAAVNVELKGGGTLKLGILQREPELVLLRSDEGIQYHFFADAGKRLLSPPGTIKPDAVTK